MKTNIRRTLAGLSLAVILAFLLTKVPPGSRAKGAGGVDGLPLEASTPSSTLVPSTNPSDRPHQVRSGAAISPAADDAGAAPARVAPKAVTWFQMCELDSKTHTLPCMKCRLDSECPVDHGCLVNRDTHGIECLPSNCTQDTDCPGGSACLVASKDGKVRRCIEAGSARPGATCTTDPWFSSISCEEGLLCVKGRCGLPCLPEREEACGPGQACRPSANGHACETLDCRHNRCEGGATCERVGQETYACIAKQIGPNCFRDGCPRGQECQSLENEGTVAFHCATPCNPMDPKSCPNGSVCGKSRVSPTDSVCYVACSPDKPTTCREQETCFTVSEDHKTWGCAPTPYPTFLPD